MFKPAEITGDYLGEWLDNYREDRKFYDIVGNIARSVRAGDPDSDLAQGDIGIDFNFYQSECERRIGKAIAGSPRPSISPNADADKELANDNQALLKAHLKKYHFKQMFEQSIYDVMDYGLGYLHIDPFTGEIDQVPFVDVYADQSLARWYDISKGRMVFIRKIVDAAEFYSNWESELKKHSITFDMVKNVSNPPGRKLVGTWVSDRWPNNQRETDTALSRRNYSSDGDGYVGYYEENTEYFICYIIDPDSDSGWSIAYYIKVNGNNYLLEKKELPWWIDRPPLFVFSQFSIQNTFYQPSLFVFLEKSQSGVNWFFRKILNTVDLIDLPPWFVPLSAKAGGLVDEYGNPIKPILGRKGETIVTASNDPANIPKVAELPTVPNQYFTGIQSIIQYGLQDQSGSPDVTQGKNPKDQSGIALQVLEEQASTRMIPLSQNNADTLSEFGKYLTLILQYNVLKSTLISEVQVEYSHKEFEKVAEYVEAILSGEIESPDGVNYRELFESILNDYEYDFIITPALPRRAKIEQLLIAMQNPSVQMLSMMPQQTIDENGQPIQTMAPDPMLALEIAANLVDTPKIADGIKSIITEYYQEKQGGGTQDSEEQVQQPQPEPQDINEDRAIIEEAIQRAKGGEVDINELRRQASMEADMLRREQ